MSWDENDEEEYEETEYIENWEVRFNDMSLDIFEYKEEAVDYLLEELDTLTDNQFYKDIESFGYSDVDELFESLVKMCASDFYEYLDDILLKYKLEDKFRLVNLNDDEPEFGEL